MPAVITIPFPHQPDLAATMDIQIPALAWRPVGGGWERAYRVGGSEIAVTVTQDDHALRFLLDPAPPPAAARRLRQQLRAHFPRQVATLDLTAHPALDALRDRYKGVVVMRAEPFEALVVTMLSQNRTAEITRKVYATLDAVCGGVTPAAVAAISQHELRELIRSAGPYKAPRLAATARKIAAEGHRTFTRSVTSLPGPEAVAYLTALPGVAHKTAACVLVFAAGAGYTLPVDTHLFRVAARLGLATHGAKLTATARQETVTALLGYGRDVAAAHFLFLLLGRSTCTATDPRCITCFLQNACPVGAGHPGAALAGTPERGPR